MSDATMTELEPTVTKLMSCPWCGKQPIVTSNGRQWEVWHMCQSVEGVTIETRWHNHRSEALAAWNRRAE